MRQRVRRFASPRKDDSDNENVDVDGPDESTGDRKLRDFFA